MRYYLFVIDSFGIGADSKAAEYGDEGSNTALSASLAIPGEKWNFLQKLGFGNCCKMLGFEPEGCAASSKPIASYGVLQKNSEGKDTSTGHWEIAGMKVSFSLTTFTDEKNSFPKKLIDDVEKITGRKVIGNKIASGTEIIQELGEEQMKTASLICYTSSDSVFQVAAHEKVIPHEELHDICAKIRLICDSYNIGRVIARPFDGDKETGFFRTKYRKDFSIKLPGPTFLETILPDLGVITVGVGKIDDIFNSTGINISYQDKGNNACLQRVIEIAEGKYDKEQDYNDTTDKQLIFVNLVDTDMEFGHRRNSVGYCLSVDNVSQKLEEIYKRLKINDVLAITADHGCDPTFKGTDHTREYVPLLIFGQNRENGLNLGIKNGFDNSMKDVISWAKMNSL